MIRKYHNHKLQTNLWHREEDRHNNHEKPGRQAKQSNQRRVQKCERSRALVVLVPIFIRNVLSLTSVE